MEHSAIRLAAMVEYERSLGAGRGAVMVAVDDPVEPEQRIAQSPGGGPPILAGLRGRIQRVLPERGAVVGGVADVIEGEAGFGPAVVGPLTVLGNAGQLAPGAVLVVPGELTREAVALALNARAAGICAASAQPAVIESLLGTECSALVDGSLPPMNPPPVGIVLVHGFGTQAMRGECMAVIGRHLGQPALLIPQTRPARMQRPALALALPWQTIPQTPRVPTLAVGAPVWVVGGAYDGAAGRVLRILAAGYVFPSGIRARAARVRLEGGTEVTVPTANLRLVN